MAARWRRAVQSGSIRDFEWKIRPEALLMIDRWPVRESKSTLSKAALGRSPKIIEICLLIAQHLPKSRFSKLKWLNSFFNCWMDLNWKLVYVQINNFDSKTPIRLLQRVVYVHDLTTLSIHYTTSHFATLFQTIRSSSLARTLQTLKLRGHVKMFASLRECCAHKFPLENLTELDLGLYCDDDKDEKKSSLTLEPFLRSLAPTLRSLNITCIIATLDISMIPWFSFLT